MDHWIARWGRGGCRRAVLALLVAGCAPEDPGSTRTTTDPQPTTGANGEVAPGLEPDDIPQNPTMLRKSDLPPPEAPEPSPEVPPREPDL